MYSYLQDWMTTVNSVVPQMYPSPVAQQFQARNVCEKSMIRPFDKKETTQ